MRETNLYSIAFNNKEDAVQLKNRLKEFSLKDSNDGHIYSGFLSFDIVEKTDEITAVILTYLKLEEFNHITQECYNYSELLNKNIVKKVCVELGITQKELAEKLGIKEQSLRNMTSSNKITEQVEKTINLLIENNELKKQLTDYNILKEVLKNLIK